MPLIMSSDVKEHNVELCWRKMGIQLTYFGKAQSQKMSQILIQGF